MSKLTVLEWFLAGAWTVFSWTSGFAMMYFFKDFLVERYRDYIMERSE